MVTAKDISSKILSGAIENNNLSHAYLFQTNDSLETNELLFSFVKKIFYTNQLRQQVDFKNISDRIDNQNLTELKIIKPEGQWIKKEQILELQKIFSVKSTEFKHLLYIIDGAEKLNKTSANTMLKFLEEPNEGVIGILLTKNIGSVLETIQSRCQVINISNTMLLQNDCFSEQTVEDVFEFLKLIETNGINTIANLSELWNNNYETKEQLNRFFEILLYIYSDILEMKLFDKTKYLHGKKTEIKLLSNCNSIDRIAWKINYIISFLDILVYNVNTNLAMDKFIIEFSRSDENDSCRC